MTLGRRPGLMLLLATGALLLGPARGSAREVLRVSGTGTALGTIGQLVPAFERANPGVAIKLLPSVGSSGAIQAVAEGALDLGLSGRPLVPGEQARGLAAVAYARTPFVFAAGPRVSATGLDAAQLVRIYRGEISAWPDGERVRLVLRPRTDVDTMFIRAISPELDAAMEVGLAREGLLLAATNQDCNEILARTPGSVGPTTLSQLLTESHSLRPLDWNGVAPTIVNLASGAYPLGKTLWVVSRSVPPAAVTSFIAFLGSREARRILEQTGNLPVPPPPRP
jgi:phosphate transport system substrate-binding protein